MIFDARQPVPEEVANRPLTWMEKRTLGVFKPYKEALMKYRGFSPTSWAVSELESRLRLAVKLRMHRDFPASAVFGAAQVLAQRDMAWLVLPPGLLRPEEQDVYNVSRLMIRLAPDPDPGSAGLVDRIRRKRSLPDPTSVSGFRDAIKGVLDKWPKVA